MSGEVGLEHRDSCIQRDYQICGGSVSEAVGTKSRDFILDTSSYGKPVKGLKEGLNTVSVFGLEDENCR